MNYGMRTFEVIDPEWNRLGIFNSDWSNAAIVDADDHEEAATVWAEEYDQDGYYSIIDKGSHGPILVREKGEEEYRVFTISAESRPYYYANEKPFLPLKCPMHDSYECACG